MKRFLSIFVLILLSISVFSSALAADTAIVTKPEGTKGDTVRLRQKPNGTILINVPFGKEVKVLDEQDEWTKISYNGRTGWMKSEFLYSHNSEAVLVKTEQHKESETITEHTDFVLVKESSYEYAGIFNGELIDTCEYRYGIDGRKISETYTYFDSYLNRSSNYTITYEYKYGKLPDSGRISGTTISGEPMGGFELYLHDYYGNLLRHRRHSHRRIHNESASPLVRV